MPGRIHSVRTAGFGYLQSDGKGWNITWRSIYARLARPKTETFQSCGERACSEERGRGGTESLNNKAVFGNQFDLLFHLVLLRHSWD